MPNSATNAFNSAALTANRIPGGILGTKWTCIDLQGLLRWLLRVIIFLKKRGIISLIFGELWNRIEKIARAKQPAVFMEAHPSLFLTDTTSPARSEKHEPNRKKNIIRSKRANHPWMDMLWWQQTWYFQLDTPENAFKFLKTPWSAQLPQFYICQWKMYHAAVKNSGNL